LGNVKTIRKMLDESRCEELKGITVVGVGGVSDAAGFRRMRKVGAGAVGVGTALGREGVGVFEKIAQGLSGEDFKP
jgi:dihydroorotate dehydrogenase (fumarate)